MIAFDTPAAKFDVREYFYNLFRRGAVNVVHGPSGVGKSRLMLELEDAARNGREFLGYRGEAVNPLFLLRDRPIADYRETLDSMGIPRDFLRVREIPDYLDDLPAVQWIADMIEEYDRPTVVVEGLDLCMSTTKGLVLKSNLKALQRVAEHTGCAIIGTWGTPKRQSNPRSMYLNPRDAAVGGAELARMSSTMVCLAPVYRKMKGEIAPAPTERIHASIDMRSGKQRTYSLQFSGEQGRLMEIEEAYPTALAHLSFGQAVAFANRVLNMSQKTFYRWRNGEKRRFKNDTRVVSENGAV